MTKMTSTIVTLGALMIPALAVAQSVSEMDTDGDGTVSFEEVQAAYPEMTEEDFENLDTNGDGALDDAEVEAAKAAGLMEAPMTD
ncbi:EF hand [Salinihabitans flavidus]|uniref:EF hand n=1 Tax=Salinihabitans flavidus TaxID=569882 RepID=A0A1H8VB73_9RHOB|nr:EF-hand domain-containing protein [Salinihabitans flavidus]SEP12700.1 EF hand [Salinihabitans flavidus]